MTTFVHAKGAELITKSAVERPVIGISGSNENSNSVQFILARIHELGGHPVFLDQSRIAQIDDDIRYLDAVIVGGNKWDINAKDYGVEKHTKTKNEDALTDDDLSKEERKNAEQVRHAAKQRGEYEYALLDAVFEHRVPYLGICSGMQRLNVHQSEKDKGRLKQHVEGQQQYDPDNFNPAMPSDVVTIMPHSRLHDVGGRLRQHIARAEQPIEDIILEENSLHHQVVDSDYIRSGFIASAYSKKHNTVEAIEPDDGGPYAGFPIIGVQWHPEYGVTQFSQTLFEHLMSQAQERRANTSKDMAHVKRMDRLSDAMRDRIDDGTMALYKATQYTTPWMHNDSGSQKVER